jgi:competence protein ComEC
MATQVHFINVGQGNMVLLQLDDGKTFLYDCNVTQENEAAVIRYMRSKIGYGKKIDVFICSHRDADHMRGISKVHEHFPIQHIWDSGVTGTTPDSTEYLQFMELRRRIGFTEIEWKKRWDYGNTRLRIMNSKNNDLAANANAQSIVIKVVHRNRDTDTDHDSILLTGDTDAVTWKHIHTHYEDSDLGCSLLLGSHHGSLTYFDDPSERHYFTSHIQAKKPSMTILSVGDNPHGHPDPKAVEFYEKYSTGASNGTKVVRTDTHGHIHATLKDGGGWSVNWE